MQPPWPGRLLDLTYSHPQTLKPVTRGFDPRGAGVGLWVYRRILDPRNFAPGTFPGSSGITLVNWPQNDYWLGPLTGPGVTPEDARRHVARAKQLSLSLLYWLQTECPRPDGKIGWKGLKLRPDLVGTDDGLAKAPYIRESRRILAEFTVLEQHVGTEARRSMTKSADPAGRAVRRQRRRRQLPDRPAPQHRRRTTTSTSARCRSRSRSGALIPRRVENLLPACKNLGTTHITNGCYRLHPVEWAIGEAAGALAAFCLEQKESPRAVRNTAKRLAAFQSRLTAQGVEIAWPRLSPR